MIPDGHSVIHALAGQMAAVDEQTDHALSMAPIH